MYWLWTTESMFVCLGDIITLTLTEIVKGFPLVLLGVLVDRDHLVISAACLQETAGTTIAKGGGGHDLTQGTGAETGRGNETGIGSGTGTEIGRETGRETGTGRGKETGTGKGNGRGTGKKTRKEREKGMYGRVSVQ